MTAQNSSPEGPLEVMTRCIGWLSHTGQHAIHAVLAVSLMTLAPAAADRSGGLAGVSQTAAGEQRQRLTGSELQRELERSVIRDLVRAHQRGADAAWLDTVASAIHAEAHAVGVDPLLVASIVAKESSFRQRVISHRGAVGLMQLRPFVARDVARRTRVEWRGMDTLYHPELNVRLGARYFSELVRQFDGDATKALTAYNYGPTRVSRQIASGTYAGSRYARHILDLYGQLSTRLERVAAPPVAIAGVSSTERS